MMCLSLAQHIAPGCLSLFEVAGAGRKRLLPDINSKEAISYKDILEMGQRSSPVPDRPSLPE